MTREEDIQQLIETTTTNEQLRSIAKKILVGERISFEDGVTLYEQASLSFVGTLADYIRTKKHGSVTYFNRNFHIEPTNLCVFDCKFCSYSRLLKQRSEGWVMSSDEMLDIVRSYQNKPVTEVHVVGGVLPELNLRWFADIIRDIKILRPELHVKGFTAVELEYMIRKAKMSIREGLQFLKDAGLGSLPGGGAEIFDETVRAQICADKCDSATWLEIHKTAHELGLPSNATILYGHVESYTNRVDHMERLRKLQDLDNFPHIKAYWPMIGRQNAQLSLNFGVNDIDGTIDDTTKIYSMAGAEEQSPVMSTKEICELILTAGKIPVERDTVYHTIKNYANVDLDAEFGVDHFVNLPIINN